MKEKILGSVVGGLLNSLDLPEQRLIASRVPARDLRPAVASSATENITEDYAH